jgi:hypothetical protein
MSKLSVGVAALAMMVGAASTVSAQSSRVTYGGSLGLNIPVGTIGDVSRSGYTIMGHAQYEPSSFPVSWRADAGFMTLGAKTVNNISLGNSRNIFTINGNAVYNFDTAKDATFVPYLIGGVGIYAGNRGLGTNLGLNAGGGVTMKLAGFEAFGEARLHNVFDNVAYRLLPLSFGIRIKP